ncbi:DNA polymerase IV [Herbaspirillum sp. YR522]|uniref:DNA polymerase IV n=1 Tax=Herbaspirillum sp. YR522 TaxID=1144342 RepID=UPI00026F9973|nr:DNA polymerase IV [Herbaspirillum sp. YR522]EJN09731.1 nucleotidyltransferase/DNA polymerase involved in DNA repair [Herbaspirillum sp. YR522]
MAADLQRRIAHIDMDAFFASCELSRYPELKGLPVVVAGRQTHAPRTLPDGTREFSRLKDYVGRGVLTTATYEARALGVHSAMPTMKAARLAPEAVLLPVNFELYRQYSRQFKDAVRSVSPTIEDIGIDEVYADISLLEEDAHSIARRLKSAVFEATQLTCSVGIAPNKLLAKLCSDMQKPDGITIVTMDDLPSRIWPMDVRKINGIGPKSTARLEGLGIRSIGELAACAEDWLLEHFGQSYGRWLHRVSHGLDERPVVTHSEPVSMSRETTFERDLHAVRDRQQLGEVFTRLCQQVAADLERKGYVCRKIGIKLRFDDFETVTRDVTFPTPLGDATAIRHAAGTCLKRIELSRSIRLLGVKASGLQRPGADAAAVSPQFSLDFDGAPDSAD